MQFFSPVSLLGGLPLVESFWVIFMFSLFLCPQGGLEGVPFRF